MRWNRRRLIILLLMLAISLLLFGLYQGGQLAPVENLVLQFLTPAQGELTQGTTEAQGLLQSLADLGILRQQIAELERERDALLAENVRLREAERENVVLREQLGYQQAHPQLELLPAQVVGRDPTNLLRTLLIDKGAEDGVRAEMVVVTPRGLVGRIDHVGSNWAQVLLITDMSSSVNAMVQRSRATGVVQGYVGGRLVMRYIPQGESVVINDLILTSGLGGAFPKGLLIGQVTEVRQKDIEMFQEAEIQSIVNFYRLEQVLVVLNFTATELGSE
ncbi:MAG: rod shape-determining protein MreC [Chloroflexi bacterium]|nr:rod shape-determining protein MreC [Chloroflexota bacterium]MBU1747891.1 rod shape-determining protein MreC [Chloroflexota bacterium]